MNPTVVDGKKIYYWDLKKNGWKYQLADYYAIQVPVYPETDICYPKRNPFVWLSSKGLLTFRIDYCWDGASGPTIDTKSSMRGALVHDGLYQLMRAGLLPLAWREKADELLRDICVEDGMWRWRAALWFRAVRTAAGPAAKKGHDVTENIQEAP